VTAAAVRLSASPAPTGERLLAAEAQIVKAAKQGVQLVVLPEVFNTGYVYSDENYPHAELLDGPTVTWMKRLAAEYGIHLAGSLMLLGPEHITNSLILVAPDGRLWRYDKNFPCVWERLYFREGRDITVARTDIGTFGLMICADVFSPHLFKRYAGRVQALIISASPPKMQHLMFEFPDGERISLAALAKLPRRYQELADQTFDQHVRRFTSWMRVPVVQSIPYGRFSSHIPIPWLSFGILLASKPSLWRYIPQGRCAVATAEYFDDNQIVDANGNVLARYDADDDGFALATIELADSTPLPSGKPPGFLPLPGDEFNWLLVPFYRRGVRRAWGRRMAPVDRSTHIWSRLLIASGVMGYTLGWLGTRRRRKRK
jgi:predicted amidohydrolase